VIEDAGNKLTQLIRFDTIDGRLSPIAIPYDDLKNGVNYFPHPEKDIAIIKVDNNDKLGHIIRQDVIDYEKHRFSLLGYPAVRRTANDKADWLRIDSDVRIHQTKADGMKEAQLANAAQYHEIVGQSGGCYVRASNGYVHVIGIQNCIATAQQEYQGRVDFTPISYFDEIIARYPGVLSAMLPPYLRCFSFLQQAAFDIDGSFFDQDIVMARNLLKRKTQEIVDSNMTPRIIKDLFNERLLIYGNDTGVLQSHAIWLVWLEFLTILKIAKGEQLDEAGLKKIFNSTRLFHSNTDKDWAFEMMNIMYSDYKGLEDNGIVFVSVAKDPEEGMNVVKRGATIGSIAQVKRNKDSALMNIDEGRKSPFDHFTFAHINCFKKQAILKEHAAYAEIDDEDILFEKLKTEFNGLLRA
jgi:hypothetical protein